MTRHISGQLLVGALFVVSSLVTDTASAAGHSYSVRLWGDVSPFLSGEAGTGLGAPDYRDLFDTGVGAGVEFSWRLSPWASAVAGLGYEVYDGRRFDGISFSDLEVVPVYGGGKLHLFHDSGTGDIYLRADIGAAHMSSVNVSYESLKGRYWDSSWGFLIDVGAGAEYLYGNWGISLEIKARRLSAPDSALGRASDADSYWTFPISLGANYHF